MGGIVCSSPYHLNYDEHSSHAAGRSSSSVSYPCVSDESSYDVNDFAVWGLQALLIALIVCAVLAVGVLTRRLLRQRMARD
jgi:hypothetical protein